MKIQYRKKIKALFDYFHAARGVSSLTLRQNVETQAAHWAGGRPPANPDPLPEVLQSYLQKVALSAYKITDDDIQQLKIAGYAEDEIFELTLSATLGASQARLDLGLGLLQQGKK